MIFHTETGSTYEIAESKVRRVNAEAAKRADGEWVRLLNDPWVEVGFSVLLVLEPLSGYGPDDYGFEDGLLTTRKTSRVTSIEI